MATASSNIDFSLSYPLNPKNLKVGIATAMWNSDITLAMQNAAIETLTSFGFEPHQILIKTIPGAFELPLSAQWMLEVAQCDAVICFGCVIKGATPHFDYVCDAATRGILEVGLKYHKPCIFGVLTVNTKEQAEERVSGGLSNKGAEDALTLLNMLALKQDLLNQQA